VSEVLDVHHVPLDSDVAIGSQECAQIMRRICFDDEAAASPVSAFNSSI
jgi:hypothetical protein